MKDFVTKDQDAQKNTKDSSYDSTSLSSFQDITQRKGISTGLSAYQIAQRKQQETGMEPEGDAISRFHSLKSESSKGAVVQKQDAGIAKVNNTGLPDNLKSGIENLSGYSMDDVKVHYNSDKPAQLQAHAYAQGSDIHLASGQEQHLPHEAWHVVQQKQGRVQPTLQMKGGAVNDNPGLEQEADVKGAEALKTGTVQRKSDSDAESDTESVVNNSSIIQRRVGFEFEDGSWKGWKQEGAAVRAAARKEELHNGNGYKLEGDDTPGDGTANIEWVTKPFDPTPQGLAELNTTMYDITAKYARLNNYVGRRGQNYVRAREHQLSHNDTLLNRGHANGSIKMQATFGSSLEDLPTVMKYFGGNVPGETAGEGQNRTQSRNMMYGANVNLAARVIPTVLGNAPSLARQTIAEMEQIPTLTPPQQGALAGNTNALQGFLSVLMMYMKMLQLPLGGPVKYRLPFLGRTNLAAMFAEVNPDQRAVLSHNNAQYLKHSLLTISNANPMVRNGAANVDVGLAAGTSLIANKPALAAMTIGTWLEGITNGIDYLHQTTMDDWLVQQGGAADAGESLESLSVINDNLGGTDGGLVVMENRAISPGGLAGTMLTIQQVHQMAYNYLQFFVNVAQQNVGAYPNQAPPARPRNRGCCYITTACVTTLCLPDDCEELTTLRAFRDNYILKKEYGKELVEIYYNYSPLIVEAIEEQNNSTEVYSNLYTVIADCVGHIKRQEDEMAFKIYLEMVLKLKDLYLNNEEINVPKEYLK